MEWRSASDPVRGPVVLVRDTPGGAIDRLVADPDVTTFFNDRFHPVFVTSDFVRETGTIHFLDGCGCPLGPVATPRTAAAILYLANTVIVRPDALACQGQPFAERCTTRPP